MDLKKLGGAQVYFCWIKGRGMKVDEYVFEKWLEDKEAKVLFCNTNFENHEGFQKGIAITFDKFVGAMECRGGSFTFF